MLIFDRLKMSTERIYTDEGFLTSPARIAKTGIQEYTAESMGKSQYGSTNIVRVYRPPEEVFSEDSLKTFAFKPVTNEHPPELVNAKNARNYQVGLSGHEVVKDGDFVKTTITITDGDTIDSIKNGKVELSNGYTADIDWTPGTTPEGLEYDAIQRNIRGNHIAVVQRGRAGPQVRVADNQYTEAKMATITIDQVEYEVTPQVAQAVGKLQTQLNDATLASDEAAGKAETAYVEAEKAKADADAAKAMADAALAKVPTAEQIDKLVQDRAEFVAKCKAIVPTLDCTGKSVEVLKREVVAAKCANVQLDSVSADYINARFDILAESKTDVLDEALKARASAPATTTDSRPLYVIARERMVADSQNAWKTAGEAK
jgi:hypothetical protein